MRGLPVRRSGCPISCSRSARLLALELRLPLSEKKGQCLPIPPRLRQCPLYHMRIEAEVVGNDAVLSYVRKAYLCDATGYDGFSALHLWRLLPMHGAQHSFYGDWRHKHPSHSYWSSYSD